MKISRLIALAREYSQGSDLAQATFLLGYRFGLAHSMLRRTTGEELLLEFKQFCSEESHKPMIDLAQSEIAALEYILNSSVHEASQRIDLN